MDPPPPDAADRQEALERWAHEQTGTGPVRLRTKVARRLPITDPLLRGLVRVSRTAYRAAGRVLDRGLNTSSRVHLPEHTIDDRVPYVPSSWHVLPRALRYVGVSDRDTFVDFGCGK